METPKEQITPIDENLINKMLEEYARDIRSVKENPRAKNHYGHVAPSNEKLGIDHSSGIYEIVVAPDGLIEIFNLKGCDIKSLLKISWDDFIKNVSSSET